MSYQTKVNEFVLTCFGVENSVDVPERSYRFAEEAIELVQSLGCSKEDLLKVVDYVYARPAGAPGQEVGGVMTTLAALCTAVRVDMETAGAAELQRVWGKIEGIRAKNLSKPRGSPLPGKYPGEA